MKHKPGHKEVTHHRSKYVHHKLQFVEWVNRLGLEKTFFGRLILRLEELVNARRLLLLFLFCVMLSGLLLYEFDFSVNLREGDIATSDIKSPISFEIVDEVATETKRIASEQSIPPVFDYDAAAYENIINTNIYNAFREMRSKVRQIKWPKNEYKREELIKDFLKHKGGFEEVIGRAVSNQVFEWLVANKFSARLENTLIHTLEAWSSYYIVETADAVIPVAQDRVLIRELNKGGDVLSERPVEKSELKVLTRHRSFSTENIVSLGRLKKKDRRNLVKLAHLVKIPNANFNKRETSERQQKAREGVLPVVIAVKKNQVIVNQGSVVRPIHVRFLREIEKLKSNRQTGFLGLALALLFMTVVIVSYSYLSRFTEHRIKVDGKDIFAIGVVTFFVVIITKIFLFVTETALLSRFGTKVPTEVFMFAAPVAAGPMLVGLLISSGEIVWLFTVFLAIALSFLVEASFPFLVVTILGGVAAIRGVFGCKKRNDIYWAGLRTGIVNAIAILMFILANQFSEGSTWSYMTWLLPAGFFSGIFASLVAMMIIPLLESAFNYTTDVKLMELSNLNHPLMREMIVKAPGTYHHSLVVGSMVEAAAEQIGANPLLAKVMSYYHDIGKMEYADYFIENQKPGKNPHDHLSPHMSKTILIAHVKDGVELGMKYKLGKPIIDGILQHHGTTLISFFYNKALEAQDEDLDSVNEDDFRYPGPKPQFKEAALCMLADSIEAAARSLDEPTPMRLANIVRNIIQRKFMDGQLDECNLTLKDLSVIEQAFNHVLLGIYHQRIDYPKGAGGGASEKPKPILATESATQGKKKKGSATA